MASSGVISGPVITTPYRLPRGTTRLPIGAGAFLQNIVVAGDTFQVQTVGVFTFQVALESAASLGDIPYTVELFNETTGLVEAFSQLVCAASSSAEDQDVVLVTNVVNVAHFYSIRLNIPTGGSPNFTISLSPQPVSFQCVIMSLTGSGGGAGSAFSAITSGTNTSAVMIVGTGAMLDYSGTGTINASSLQTNFTIAGPTAPRVYTFPDANATILTTNAAVTVPQGGTGNTTFTPYSLIAAGTVATGPFQNIVGVGTAGQVLTSNGAGTLPTWQATAVTPTPTWAAVLAAGNTTGANNALITTGQQIDAATPATVLNIGNTNASGIGIGTAPGVLGTLQVFVNQGGAAFIGSNAGIQYSSTTSNRGSIRTNQFGNNAGVPGITGFKSRGTNVGDLISVADGDVLWRATAIGVTGNNINVPLAGFLSLQVPTGGTNATWVATDFAVSLVPLAGPINSNRQVFKVTSEAALDFIDGTTAPVTAAAHGGLRYNNALLRFEQSVSGAAWAPLSNTSFSAITTGTNTTAVMTVGTGASLDFSGVGVINASSLQTNFTIAGPTVPRVYTFPDATTTILTTNAAVTVPQGGTGNTTFTAYSVICAGTTATGTFQNVTGVGTAGQVLTSNGAATLPTWQTASGSTAFSAITSGTNTTAAMVVGNGATLKVAQGGSIGTSSLVASTTVLGSAGAALTASNTNSVLVGSSAGAALAGATDTNNTFIGFNAANSATGSGTGANTVLGASAAATLTTGSSNVIIGKSADVGLAAATNAVCIGNNANCPTGSVVIGASAGVANASTIRLTAVGFQTATAVTTALDCVFVGDQAGKNVTAAGSHTFIGSGAGTATTGAVASNNTFVGYQAGTSNVDGSSNTYIGRLAGTLAAGSNDISNVCVGDTSGKNINGGNGSNTFVGANSGGSVTTGSANSIFGSDAGSTNLTTGSNNVIIGSTDDTNAAGTSNAIIIGTAVRGSSTSVVISTNNINSSTTNDFYVASGDTGLNRVAAGILQPNTGAGGTGAGAFQINGVATGIFAASPASTGRIIYNSTLQHFYISENGGAYVQISTGGGGSAFSAITSGTNTTAAMIVGSGASLNFTGTGTINATSLQTNFTVAGPTAPRVYTFPDATTTVLTTNAAVTVPQGGTGNTTFTAFSVIAAGTTATGPFQNVVGVGTVGQVLTSSGAGVLPTWQAGGGVNNLIINGACDVDQRNTGGATIGTGLGADVYATDRWKAASENSNTLFSRTDTSTSLQTGLSARYYGTLAKKTTTGKQAIFQVIEANNTLPLAGRKMTFQIKLRASSSKTLRMAILSSTGTIDVMPTLVPSAWGSGSTEPTWGTNLSNIGNPTSIPTGAQGTIGTNSVSCAVTTTFQLFAGTFTMPGNAKNLILVIWTDTQFTFNTDTFSWSEAQFVDGASIRAWLPTLYQDELARCQRYFYTMIDNTDTGGLNIISCGQCGSSTTQIFFPITLPVTMRTLPSLSATAANWQGYDATTGTNLSTLVISSTTMMGNVLRLTGGGSGWVAGRAAIVYPTTSGARMSFDSDF